MSKLQCPKCGSSNYAEKGLLEHKDGSKVRRYHCQECSKYFLEEYRRLPARPAGKDCPNCGSSNTVNFGSPIKNEFGTVQRFLCKDCNKRTTPGSKSRAAKPADVECSRCQSFDTVKLGKPLTLAHGTSQPCRCRTCNLKFTLGGLRHIPVYIDGKLLHTFYDPPGLQYVADVDCPNCNEQNVVLKTTVRKDKSQQEYRILLCLSCGQEFKEGTRWQAEVLRRLGKPIDKRPWQFADDQWDLRVLYPDIDEHKLHGVFLHFDGFDTSWFKELAKAHTLWLIQKGYKSGTVRGSLYHLRLFGNFLARQGVNSMEEVDRNLMLIFWTRDRGHLKDSAVKSTVSSILRFLNWGNDEKRFTTRPNLIIEDDFPKLFPDEPDPLEDSVLEAIRDNLHVLPEQLQLMYMLGFWTGCRPHEISYLTRDCIEIDPDGSTWWLKFEREKTKDWHRLPIQSDLVKVIQQQQTYISELYGEEYPYLFCHYQYVGETGYPDFPRMKSIRKPPIPDAVNNPMVKAIRQLIKKCEIRDSNGNLAKFTGAILRPSRATHLINNGHSLEYARIWLKHRSVRTTQLYYIRYRPGELLDVATVMANMDGKFYAYDSNPESLNPESLKQNPEQHELDGLTTPGGEPLYGYCMFREFCPRFGRCYTCGFHVASADKLHLYKSQLDRLQVKRQEALKYGSSEILNSYEEIEHSLERIVAALE